VLFAPAAVHYESTFFAHAVQARESAENKRARLGSRCVRHGVSPAVIKTSDSAGRRPVGDLFTVICLQLLHFRTMYKIVGRLMAANSVAFNETLHALSAPVLVLFQVTIDVM